MSKNILESALRVTIIAKSQPVSCLKPLCHRKEACQQAPERRRSEVRHGARQRPLLGLPAPLAYRPGREHISAYSEAVPQIQLALSPLHPCENGGWGRALSPGAPGQTARRPELQLQGHHRQTPVCGGWVGSVLPRRVLPSATPEQLRLAPPQASWRQTTDAAGHPS